MLLLGSSHASVPGTKVGYSAFAYSSAATVCFESITTRDAAQAVLDEGLADLVAVGRLALANPDLVERWQRDAGLNEPDQATFYGGGAKGYIDYPTLAA